MFNVNAHIDNYLIENIKRIIRERWRTIEKTTKYGWITAYYHSRKIHMENIEILDNLAAKIGDSSCEEAIKKIELLSKNSHPKAIPIIAETVLNETYTMILLSKKSKRNKWKSKRFLTRSPTIFTISHNI